MITLQIYRNCIDQDGQRIERTLRNNAVAVLLRNTVAASCSSLQTWNDQSEKSCNCIEENCNCISERSLSPLAILINAISEDLKCYHSHQVLFLKHYCKFILHYLRRLRLLNGLLAKVILCTGNVLKEKSHWQQPSREKKPNQTRWLMVLCFAFTSNVQSWALART